MRYTLTTNYQPNQVRNLWQQEIGSFPPGVKRFFLLGAPIIALIIYWILPNTYTDIHNQVLPFNPHAKACLAVVVWMVLWWLFEPVPIPVTSLLPIPLFPLLGIAKPAQAMAPYASGTIFLFMGGFILAIAVQRWRLDKRIALTTLKLVGTKAPAIVGGFLLASGVLSMWVSNTATAAMMVPIAIAVHVRGASSESRLSDRLLRAKRNFGVCRPA